MTSESLNSHKTLFSDNYSHKSLEQRETQANLRNFYLRKNVLISSGKSNDLKIRIWSKSLGIRLLITTGLIEIPWRSSEVFYSWFSDNAESMDGSRTEPRNVDICLYRIAECSHLASKDQWMKGVLDRRERSAGSHYITAVSTFNLSRIVGGDILNRPNILVLINRSSRAFSH